MASLFAITADLFFAERFEQALRRLGHQAQVVDLSAAPAPERVPDGVDLVLVDLEAGQAALALIRQAKAAGLKVLAFGPHVATALHQAAREAGADRVVAKSKLTASLADLVAGLI